MKSFVFIAPRRLPRLCPPISWEGGGSCPFGLFGAPLAHGTSLTAGGETVGVYLAKVNTTCSRKRNLGFLSLVRGPRQGSPSKQTVGSKTAVGSPIVWRVLGDSAHFPAWLTYPPIQSFRGVQGSLFQKAPLRRSPKVFAGVWGRLFQKAPLR